jgi:hypothetical protein
MAYQVASPKHESTTAAPGERDRDLVDALSDEAETDPLTLTRDIVKHAIEVRNTTPGLRSDEADRFFEIAIAAHSYALITEAIEAALSPRVLRRSRRTRRLSAL